MVFGKRSRRANWPLRGVLLGLCVGGAAYVVLAAWLQSRGGLYRMEDLLVPRLIDVLVAAWFFWVGSAIGSFLNVVAWRVPRGRSVSGLSHCPWCNTRLAARDNWPVFGWIALRGRCRTCRLPISARYPIVELCVGLTITLLGLAELYSGGANLPFAPPMLPRGPLGTPPIDAELVALTLYHTVAISSAWAMGLIRFDGHRLPLGLVLCVLLLAAGPLWVWPPLSVVPWRAEVTSPWGPPNHFDALLRLITGLAAATLVARAIARHVCPTADPKLDPTGSGTRRMIDLAALLAVPAIVVGWQALLGVVIAATVLGGVLLRRVGLGRDGFAWLVVCLPLALTLQIALWRPLEQTVLWPGATSPPWAILGAAAVLLVLPVVLRERRVRGKGQHFTTPSPREGRTR